MLEMDKITYIVELYSPDGLLLTLYEGQQLPIGFIEKGDEIFSDFYGGMYHVDGVTKSVEIDDNRDPNKGIIVTYALETTFVKTVFG